MSTKKDDFSFIKDDVERVCFSVSAAMIFAMRIPVHFRVRLAQTNAAHKARKIEAA